jgi:hypothetical protein
VKKLIAVLLIALIPSQLLAWGPKGHAIVADIAASRLTPITKQNLQLLLGADSLASIASWADSVRKEHDESIDWHFVDIPKNASGFPRSATASARRTNIRTHYRITTTAWWIESKCFKKSWATKKLPAQTGWKR